jgi:hypothetical protein
VRETIVQDLFRVPEPQRKTVAETNRRLLDIALRNRGIQPPVGFDIQHDLFSYAPNDSPAKDPPIGYKLAGGIFWYYWVPHRQRVDVQPVSMVGYFVMGNEQKTLFASLHPWLREKDGDVYLEPEKVGEVAGFPLHDNGVLVMTRRDRPLVVPAFTVEERLRSEIAAHRENLAFPNPTPQGRALADRCIAELEGKLARLSPAQRAGAVYVKLLGVSPRDCTLVVDAGTKGARRAVRLNPDFYDRKLPRTDLQLVVVNFSMWNPGDRSWHARVWSQLRDGLDYAALAALLK